MTSEKGSVGRFIGFFRLVGACVKPGCPVCRCLVADAHRDRLLTQASRVGVH